MKKAGLRFGQDQRQNIWHDSDEIVVYREKYVSRRLDKLNHKGLPIKAEVFLDESYYNLDHDLKGTWYIPDSLSPFFKNFMRKNIFQIANQTLPDYNSLY